AATTQTALNTISPCPATELVFPRDAEQRESKIRPAPLRLPRNARNSNARRASSFCTRQPPNQIRRSANTSAAQQCSSAIRRGPRCAAHKSKSVRASLRSGTSVQDYPDRPLPGVPPLRVCQKARLRLRVQETLNCAESVCRSASREPRKWKTIRSEFHPTPFRKFAERRRPQLLDQRSCGSN